MWRKTPNPFYGFGRKYEEYIEDVNDIDENEPDPKVWQALGFDGYFRKRLRPNQEEDDE